jgi:dipeptidyl aminopeptidase/acylaminoacyl peptidase
MRTLVMLAAGAALAATAGTARADLPPLIPREVLFGNPEKTGPQLSPDGKYLAYIAPDEKNVLQVWVRAMTAAEAKPVTADPKRGIRIYFWAYDGQHLLYLQDDGGDENFHLHAVNVQTRQDRDLTPIKGVRVQGLVLDRNFPGEILVGINERNRMVFDMHRVNLATGERKLDTQNPGMVVGWTPDHQFRIRAAVQARIDGGSDLLFRENPDQPFKKVKSWTAEEQGSPVGFTPDGKSLYVIANHEANTARLLEFDPISGKETVLAEDPEYDVTGVEVHPTKHHLQAVGFYRAKMEWKVLDPDIQADVDAITKIQRGQPSIGSRTTDDSKWLVSFTSDTQPTNYYVYDRATKKHEFLFTAQTALAKYKLAEMKPIEFKARDGLLIRGYVTTPVGIEAKNLPMVLNVHGGPWARDTWGYRPEVQWLANRGYAVLQVNFRGSTGYGKQFLNAGNREWAGKMHDDLLDAVDWAVKQGIADKNKVAIMGGSYGGYATLVGLTFTPEVFCCGVDIVGPSNIVSLLKTIPPYWAPMKAVFTTRVGSLETEESFLQSRSPLFKADQIVKPLLIGQGANDPRVKQAESDQIVEAMKKNGKPVTYVVYTDEGHGFARPENRLHFYAITEEFLTKYLGGRSEPMGDIKGHSGVVKEIAK